MKKIKITFCQSCAKPLSDKTYKFGTNADGSLNEDYCSLCYSNGSFNNDISRDEMIELAVSRMLEDDPAMDEAKARDFLTTIMPMLNRWA